MARPEARIVSFYGKDYPDVPEVDPYGETLDGANLLDKVEAMLARFVAFPSEHTRVATLWQRRPRLGWSSLRPLRQVI